MYIIHMYYARNYGIIISILRNVLQVDSDQALSNIMRNIEMRIIFPSHLNFQSKL